ncbi:hypothetical protein [Cupriavidus sp. AU9028]|uniref:hypothetical protein n=1 Tax=Cupriavidus sp. AU9028 TaxID=2871157 RepID=UPI001C96E8CC|nr:hypothetical protein [Cupriavidus sp. AU9028]MBY4896303.1 hypothetical protein [Cupriavidus sp. AU9028]
MSRVVDRRHAPRASNDIGALGEKVPGFNPARYYDQQEVQAAQAADRRWPRLAHWLGYREGQQQDSGPAEQGRPT